jgi:hypothetical protein
VKLERCYLKNKSQKQKGLGACLKRSNPSTSHTQEERKKKKGEKAGLLTVQ